MKPVKEIILGILLVVVCYLIYQNVKEGHSQHDSNIESIVWDNDITNSGLKRISNYDLVKLIDGNQNTTLEKLLKERKVDPDVVNYNGLRTALLYAASELKTESFFILARYGADINYRDSSGNTALINATSANNYLAEYAKSNYRIIEYLVKNGAEINAYNQYGQTPILGSIISREFDVLKFLVENGGDVFYLDKDGANYLFYASDIKIIEYLVSQGLDINSMKPNDENVIQLASPL